jgi:superfamily I DNA/RNA helicase
MQEEAAFITAKMVEAHAQGTPWKDMAVLYRNWKPTGTTLCSSLKAANIPYVWKDSICFRKSDDQVKILPFHSSKGLEFPLVAIPGGDTLQTGDGTDEQEMRLLYVAMTRATEQLVVTVRDGAGEGCVHVAGKRPDQD